MDDKMHPIKCNWKAKAYYAGEATLGCFLNPSQLNSLTSMELQAHTLLTLGPNILCPNEKTIRALTPQVFGAIFNIQACFSQPQQSRSTGSPRSCIHRGMASLEDPRPSIKKLSPDFMLDSSPVTNTSAGVCQTLELTLSKACES